MSRLEKLAALVKEGHAVAARDLFKLFEERIAKYEEEIRLLKEVNSRQQEELDSLLKPEVVLHRADGGRHTPSKEEEVGPTLQQQITKYPLSYNDETPELVVKEEEQLREFLITPTVCEKSQGKLEEPKASSDSHAHCNPGGGLSDNSSDTDDSADWETELPARNWMTTKADRQMGLHTRLIKRPVEESSSPISKCGV